MGFLDLDFIAHTVLIGKVAGAELPRFSFHPLPHHTVLFVSFRVCETRADGRTPGGIFFVQATSCLRLNPKTVLTGFFVWILLHVVS